jgi:hypothetical protein
MKFRFSKFVVKVANFCEENYHKIKVVFIERINLFEYSIQFIKMKGGAK